MKSKMSVEPVLAYLLAFLLTFPLFLTVGGNSIVSLGQSIWARQPGVTLPAAVIPIAGLLVIMLVNYVLGTVPLRLPRTGIILLVVLFVLASTFSLLLSMLSGFSAQATLFYLQTISPIALLFIATYLMRKPQRARPLLLVIILGGAVASWGLLVQSILERGFHAMLTTPMMDHIGPFYIWGPGDYFPVVVAYTAVLGMALFFYKVVGWKTFLAATLPAVLLLPFVWSKGALATFAMAAVLVVTLIVAKGHLTKRVLLLSSLAIVLVLVLLLGPLDTIVVQRLRLDLARGESVSLSSRWGRWEQSLDVISETPLIGIGFAPERSSEATTGKVFRSHNQYLDLWLKGGIFVLTSFLLLALWALRVLVYRYNHAATHFERGLTFGVLTGWAAVLLISNMLQINFGQPYTASLLWFTLGLVEGYFLYREPSHREMEPLLAESRIGQVSA